jgi:FkbM family methyltransferase
MKRFLTWWFKLGSACAQAFPRKLHHVLALRLATINACGNVRREVYPGTYLDLDLGDWLQRLYCLSMVEKSRFDLLTRMVAPGGTFIDIGANVGLYTCIMARHLGSQGLTLAFEPMTECVEQLRRNVALNQIQNVQIAEMALSNREGAVDLFVPAVHPGGPSAATQVWNPGDWKKVGGAPSTTLDSFFEGNRLDLIKIDVQGHEWEVLEGAREVIERFRPIILCETERNNLRKVTELAGALNYEVRTEEDGQLHPFVSHEMGWADLFLLPQTKRI